MANNKECILSKQYEALLIDMYNSFANAKMIYKHLPKVISEADTAWRGESIGYYLANGKQAMKHLLESFNVEIPEDPTSIQVNVKDGE